MLDQTVVFQAQGIPRRLEPAVAIRKPARLGALAAVSRASADDARKIALPRVAHAKRAVDKNLDFHRASSANVPNLLHRKLARQHDPAASELRCGHNALERVNRHLRRRMNRHRRRNLLAQLHHTKVLHDERIHSEHGRRPDDLRRACHLPVGDERVERQMHLHAAHMAIDNRLLQFVGGEILRAHAGVEHIISKINRVRSVLHSGAQRLHRARGRKQFEHVVLPSSVFRPRFSQGIAIVQYIVSQAGERRKYFCNLFVNFLFLLSKQKDFPHSIREVPTRYTPRPRDFRILPGTLVGANDSVRPWAASNSPEICAFRRFFPRADRVVRPYRVLALFRDMRRGRCRLYRPVR